METAGEPFFRGYDQIILQSLFQDLQSKIGTI
jgi:hypothetical protein